MNTHPPTPAASTLPSASELPDPPARLSHPDLTGRKSFGRYRSILRWLARGLAVAPNGIATALWSVADVFPGKLGVGVRYVVLCALAKRCGNNVFVGPNVEVRGWESLVIGDNVSIHRACYIDAGGGIEIGSNVSIAHHATVMSGDHTWDDESLPIRENPSRLASVVISDDVWVGCGSRILAGVTIQSRSIVAAGAVVTRAVPSRSIVGGIPARVLKTI